MKYLFILSFFAIFLFAQLLFSQEKIVEKTDIQGLYKLSDVVISATKTQTSTIELANSITVIDSTEIANRNASSVFDLLKTEYGVSFTNLGGKGGLSNISIRGGNFDYTLVLIDGVESNLISDPSNVYDFAFLPIDNIHSIEILRGPQSTLYGSNSLSGVINISTRKGIGVPSFSFQSEAGSFKTFKNMLGMNGQIGDFNYSVTLSRLESNGFSAASEKYGNLEKDGFRKDYISARFGYNFSSQAEINFTAKYNKSKSDYDQFGGMFGDDPTYIFNQEEFLFRGEGIVNLFDQKWEQKFGASIIRNIRKYNFDISEFNPSSSNSAYDGMKTKFDWQNNFRLFEQHLITVGFEYEKEEAASEYYYFSPFFNNVSIFPAKSSNTIGLYLQNQFKYGNNLFGTIGFRIDKHDKFGSAFTFRFAPAFVIWQSNTKLKATIGSGFKTPSLFNLYDPSFGNPNLNPEKSLGFDVGAEQFFANGKFSTGITYFQNNFTDLFGYDQNFKTINVRKAKTKGIETFFVARLFENFTFKLNYTFTSAKDESDGVLEENRNLLRRPDHKIGSYISFDLSRSLNTNIEAIYVGNRDDIVFDNVTFSSSRVKLDSYLLLNFSANYQLMGFLRLNFRLENLLNSDYEEVYGYATPRLSAYGGIKLSLNEL